MQKNRQSGFHHLLNGSIAGFVSMLCLFALGALSMVPSDSAEIDNAPIRAFGILIMISPFLCAISTVYFTFWLYLLSNREKAEKEKWTISLVPGVLLYLIIVSSVSESFESTMDHILAFSVSVFMVGVTSWISLTAGRIKKKAYQGAAHNGDKRRVSA